MGKPMVFRYQLVFKADEFETKMWFSKVLLLDGLEVVSRVRQRRGAPEPQRYQKSDWSGEY